MLRYCIPMIPASISFWIINASDLFYVQGMCDSIDGKSSTWWVGLLKAGYYLPQIITIVGQIFYEAWQLSAVTEESGVRRSSARCSGYMRRSCSAVWRASSGCASP